MNQAVLEDKERLYRLQQQLLKPAVVLIQIGLCLPGGPDHYPTGRLSARAGRAVRARLLAARIAVSAETALDTSMGPISLLSVVADARTVKQMMVDLEEQSPLGRLWDIDVVGPDGPVDRSALGLAPRRCLVCDRSAHVCRKLGAHPLAEVVAAAKRIIEAGDDGAGS